MKTKMLRTIKNNSPTILTCIAAVGCISTVVMVIKATPKAIKKVEKMREPSKKDIFKAVWKDYLPAALLGVGTLVCMFSANALSRKQQAVLTSAYGVLSNQFKRYSDEVRDMFGEETHKKIVENITIEKPKDIVIQAPGLTHSTSISFDDRDENEVLFYDMMSKRYFKSTIGKVMTAIHHLNRNFCMGADPEVNMYYDFLGLVGVDYGDNIGWSLDDGLYWIDFEIFKQKADDDTLEYYIINPIFWPEPFPTE